MDKHHKRYMSKDQDAARSIVLERQQRISIESSSRMLIKNTQTQVRELYRREKQKLTVEQNYIRPEKSSSLSDGKIVEARIQVDSLNEQIVNEIGRLKSYRDCFIQAETNRSGIRHRQPMSNRTWSQSLATNNNSTDETPQDTNRSLPISVPITQRSEESRPRFRTLGVKPSSKQEKELLNMVEAEGDTETSSQERICGGCTFGNNLPAHSSVYQCDYGQSAINRSCPTHCSQMTPQMMVSHPLFQGPTTSCICCDFPSPGSSSPMSQSPNQMYQYAVSSPCQQQSQQYPHTVDVHNNYNMYPCPTYPNYTRRVTDLNTEDFCRLWCQNPRESRSPSNARSSRSSPKESGRGTSARSRTSSRSPTSSARGKFDSQVKRKLKEAGISDSTSLAQYKVQDHEKIMKVTLRKQEQAGTNSKKSPKTANEQMIIKDYIPAKSMKRNDPPVNEHKGRIYKEYMNQYQKENQKSNVGGKTVAKEEGPEVKAHPTYTKIQDLKPSGNKTPQSYTNRVYGPIKAKTNSSSQRRSGQDSGKSTKLLPPITRKPAAPTQQPQPQQSDTATTSNRRVMDKTQPKLFPSPGIKKVASPNPSTTKQKVQQRTKDQVQASKPDRSPYAEQSQRSWDKIITKDQRLKQNPQLNKESFGEKEDSEENEKSSATKVQKVQSVEQQGTPDQSKDPPQQESEFAATQDQSPLKQKVQGESTDTLREKQSEPRRRSRDDIFNKAPVDPAYSQKDQSHLLLQQERREPIHVQDKDSDSGLGRYSDSGNQTQSNGNRQKQYRTEPTDYRWGTEEGHRLSLEPHPYRLHEERMNLAPGEVESTTSVCRTLQQHLVSIKRSNKEGGPLIRRETKRYKKECVSYVTKDIGLESELPQTSQKNTSSKHGNQAKQKMPQTPDQSQSSDSLDPPHDNTRQFATMPRKQEERLTQTDILAQEERPTQTDLEASRAERRTQTEPDERHERLTQTELQVGGKHERLTQTELIAIPSQAGYIDLPGDKENNEVPQYAKSDADQLEEMSPSSRRSMDDFDGHISGDKSGYSTPDRKGNVEKQSSSYHQQSNEDQSEQHRPPIVPSSSYYSFDPLALQKKPKETVASPINPQAAIPSYQKQENNVEKEASKHMPSHGGLHHVPTQHDLTTITSLPEQEPSESLEQFERIEEDYDRYIVDPEEILCRQYRRNYDSDAEETVYSQPIAASPRRQPEYQSPSRRQQWEYSYQTGESCDGPSSSKTNTQGPVSYEWRHAYGNYSNPGKLHETCATYRQSVQRLGSNEGIISSEYSDACSSFNDDYYTAQQMTSTSSAINQVNCRPHGELPLHCYQQQHNGLLPQAYSPQEKRTQYYSQHSVNRSDNPIQHLSRTHAIEVPQQRYYNRPQKLVIGHHVNQLPPRPAPAAAAPSTNINSNCIMEKRVRTVKFNDENCQTRIKRDTPESPPRSAIDWDRAYRQGLLADKMRSGYLSESDTEMIHTCRSSSSANTEVTCVDCNYEEEEEEMEMETPRNRLSQLPPFSGCPCMLNTYIHLAELHTNK